MSRSLVLGNGSMLVCLDKRGQVKDFYFPYAGSENHIGEKCVHRIGVSIDGVFSWLDGPAWDVAVDYRDRCMLSRIVATDKETGIELEFRDAVLQDKNIFLRGILVRNPGDRDRNVKLFINQQFFIYGTSRGDTAYFEPDRNILVHYEGRRVFAISGMTDDELFEEYSVGIFGEDGKEGTWRDAEDGRLEKNPIEHGSVDSVLSMGAVVKPGDTQSMHYWTVAATKYKEAVALHDYVIKKSPEQLLESAERFWKRWIDRTQTDFENLDDEIAGLFRKSLLIIRSHVGDNGSIIASGDSDMPRGGRDTYAYVWPRDAAFVAMSLDRAGYPEEARKFFEFCIDAITDGGYMLHKYRADRSMGSSWHPWIKDGERQLAIQEDETALILHALWQHYQSCGDAEFVASAYGPLVRKAADFMCSYIEKESGLPQGSYDIWEEKFGTATFTSSSVYAGLAAAANLAKVLGEEKDARNYAKHASRIKEAISERMYDGRKNFFYRNLQRRRGQSVADATLDISSFLGIFRFGVLETDDPRMGEMLKVVENELTVAGGIGGIIRYQGDRYFQVDERRTENPWFITTLWVAQFLIASAVRISDLEKAKGMLDWVARHAQPSGILSEQLNRNTGEQLSVAPLIWSHAELVLTVMQYLEKFQELKNRK